MEIRSARLKDAASIARLSAQLGYPASEAAMARRLERVLGDERHAILLAEGLDGEVAGWLHVCERSILLTELQAAIEGLVVDQADRQQGIGRRLMAEAEQWARARGCTEVRLRSNVEREVARLFYEAVGYRHTKTQRAFVRELLDEIAA